jgi:hypothetical protein
MQTSVETAAGRAGRAVEWETEELTGTIGCVTCPYTPRPSDTQVKVGCSNQKNYRYKFLSNLPRQAPRHVLSLSADSVYGGTWIAT